MSVPRNQVKIFINDAINVAIARVTERTDELFTGELASDGNGTASPFQKLLLPEARIFSSYERSLSASLGKAFDYIAAAIAKATYGNGRHDYSLKGNIAPETLAAIENIVNKYKQKIGQTPNTGEELKLVYGAVNQHLATLERAFKSDVFFVDHEGYENYLEIKTPMPNYDQCSAMKARILSIYALRYGHTEKVRALVAFPHNPNGLIGTYSWPPLRYFFDPNNDWSARGLSLMGVGFWNFVGNSDDTYEDLLDCFYEVSVERKADLWKLLNLTVS